MDDLVVSLRCVIDRETFEFKRIQEPAIVDVPFFMYDTVRGAYQNQWNMFNKVYALELNQLTVEFTEWTSEGGFFSGNQLVFIEFTDRRNGKPVKITLSVNPHIGHTFGETFKDRRLLDVRYEFDMNDTITPYDVEYKKLSFDTHFKAINDLGRVATPRPISDMFFYGIRDKQYSVRFRGRPLNGSCYALLCGTWAILLDDDLSFDSLVFLDGASRDILLVNRFAYTVNRYITKFITLKK